MPKDGSPDGSYAVIEDGVVSFRRVHHDPEPMIARLRQLDLPERSLTRLVQASVTGSYPAGVGGGTRGRAAAGKRLHDALDPFEESVHVRPRRSLDA